MDLRRHRVATLFAALGIALALPAAQQDPARAEADLRRLAERIQRVQQQVQRDEVEKNRLNRELRDAERSVSKARSELSRLRGQRAERSAIRRHLEEEKVAREAERARTEAELARQLRAAYFMGRNEPLKLLLNQRSPAEFSRNLAYYGYLGRLRTQQMALIAEDIAKIEELGAEIAAEDAELARLEAAQQEQVSELDKARRQRGTVLASLEKEAGGRTASLRRLRQEREQLERTIERLRREARTLPYDPDLPFAQSRGRLNWPVAGKITRNYGATITTDSRSTGIDIDTTDGAPVRAIHEGRVMYADWHPGRGQLVIVDHGGEYWSIYAHLGELYVETGRKVAGGDTIGTAGDSGGRPRPGLYFELLRNKPIDPRPWFRSAAPPAR
jgi:septal ring factor EnvC (AmiA/AmiB activator)